jgi:lipopolysaccharide biosynthesis glycosyltransferase
MNKMNIAVNINRAFVDVTTVMFKSLLKTNQNSYVNFYILNNDLMDVDIAKMNQQLNIFSNFKIFDAKVDDSIFPKNNSNFADRWGKQAFYRLLIAEVLPRSIERLLYLDADIIINGTLEELYCIDFRGNYIAACEDTEVSDYYTIDRLGINKANTYLNAGVILFNLDLIRKDGIMTMPKLIEILDQYKDRLLFWDQDILNLLFHGRALVLDYRIYNFLCARKRYTAKQLRMYKGRAIIYHYGGEKWHRPWNEVYVGGFGELFWENARDTLFWDNKKNKYYINKFFKPIFILEFEIYYFWNRIKGRLLK